MSQAFQDISSGEPERTTYTTVIRSPADLEAVEVYATENPGARILLDYQTPIISRGAKEEPYQEDRPVHVRSLGGATSYEGSSTNGLIESGRCFEDVQVDLLSEVQEIVGEDVYLDDKDIFLDEGKGRQDTKILGFGGRMGGPDTPNLYGATWRERSLTGDTREIIEEDVVQVTSDEIQKLSYAVEEETGQNFREHLEGDAHQVSPEELLEPGETADIQLSGDSSHEPTSCTVHWRPEQGYNVRREKAGTALWPWDIS